MEKRAACPILIEQAALTLRHDPPFADFAQSMSPLSFNCAPT